MEHPQKMMYRDEERYENLQRCFGKASIRSMEGAGNERRFQLSFSSEEAYERWWGTEILDHEENCVDLTRLNEIGVVLFNHSTDKVIGRIEKAWIEKNRGEAIIVFDEDEMSETIFKKVESGTLKGVSVGYAVSIWEDLAANKKSGDGRFTGPCSIARKWMPYEISVVSVPADATVGVGRSRTKEVKSLELYEKQLQINETKAKIGGKL